ncbi:MAG: GtrA family protein [Candidatus Izemoplasmatales bacterium]|jgi:putative flippase GtrA|nr:GtrA family protein [Candidatus Izemoplasmatales bacterium]MDD3865283.1 GtrA family protein [Candidatus Izemoplasmatales bacterium]
MENTENSNTITTDIKLTSKQNFFQFFKFTLFSISAGIIQILSFTILNLIFENFFAGASWLTSEYGLAYFVALVLSVLWNFTINRKFTFKSATNVPIAMLKVFLYYCVFTPLSIWWGVALERLGWNDYLILLPTMVINMVTEFLYCRLVVYRHSINTAINKKNQDSEVVK